MENRIINVCGHRVNSDLKIAEVEKDTNLKEVKAEDGIRAFESKEPIAFLDGHFDVRFEFGANGLINVFLVPVDNIASAGFGSMTQRSKWERCKKVMFEGWGRPVFSDKTQVFYKFEETEVFCSLVLEGSQEGGGRIVIAPHRVPTPQ